MEKETTNGRSNVEEDMREGDEERKDSKEVEEKIIEEVEFHEFQSYLRWSSKYRGLGRICPKRLVVSSGTGGPFGGLIEGKQEKMGHKMAIALQCNEIIFSSKRQGGRGYRTRSIHEDAGLLMFFN